MPAINHLQNHLWQFEVNLGFLRYCTVQKGFDGAEKSWGFDGFLATSGNSKLFYNLQMKLLVLQRWMLLHNKLWIFICACFPVCGRGFVRSSERLKIHQCFKFKSYFLFIFLLYFIQNDKSNLLKLWALFFILDLNRKNGFNFKSNRLCLWKLLISN